jgi:hypothetical protein
MTKLQEDATGLSQDWGQLWSEITRLEDLLDAAVEEMCVHNPCFDYDKWSAEVMEGTLDVTD